MRRDEAMKLLARSGGDHHAIATIRSRLRREERAATRKAKVSVKRIRKDRFAAAVETSFKMVQDRVTPLGLKVRE